MWNLLQKLLFVVFVVASFEKILCYSDVFIFFQELLQILPPLSSAGGLKGFSPKLGPIR